MDRRVVVSSVEGLEVERLLGLGRPQTDVVRVLGLETGDREVVRDGEDLESSSPGSGAWWKPNTESES